jgi:hypothetical protein
MQLKLHPTSVPIYKPTEYLLFISVLNHDVLVEDFISSVDASCSGVSVRICLGSGVDLDDVEGSLKKRKQFRFVNARMTAVNDVTYIEILGNKFDVAFPFDVI